jgi:hypothetical protein
MQKYFEKLFTITTSPGSPSAVKGGSPPGFSPYVSPW